MASRNATLAQAVTDALNAAPGGTFLLPFTAVRRAVPLTDLKLLKTLSVSVIYSDDSSDRVGRDVDLHALKILIGIEKKVAAADVSTPAANAEIDQLCELVEQIDNFWDQTKVSESVGLFVNSTIVTLCDPGSMLTQKVFRGVVAVSFNFVVSP